MLCEAYDIRNEIIGLVYDFMAPPGLYYYYVSYQYYYDYYY